MKENRESEMLKSSLSFLFILSLIALPVRSEIVHGYADFMNGGFDFSEHQTTSCMTPEADLCLVIIVDPPLGWRLASFNGSRVLIIPDSSLQDLTTAPSDTSMYHEDALVFQGVTYVIRTSDGIYAKFAIVRWIPYVEEYFEYFIQMDGTTNLDSTSPIATHTWGCIKSLYK